MDTELHPSFFGVRARVSSTCSVPGPGASWHLMHIDASRCRVTRNDYRATKGEFLRIDGLAEIALGSRV